MGIDRQVTEFGEHVRGWRMVLGLTAQQVSERAGITRDTLRKIESGNPNVSFNSVTQVLEQQRARIVAQLCEQRGHGALD